MEYARRPPELSSGKAMDLNWRNWKQQFIAFLKVSGLCDDQPEVHKTALLLNLIGPVGQQAFEEFNFDSPSDKENMDIVLEKFDEYYDPVKSEAEERNIFFTTKKRPRESIDQYVNELRIKARTCNFGELTDSLIRDKIILETTDRALRKHLLSEPDLSLSQTINLWQTHAETVEKVMQVRNLEKKQPNSNVRAQSSGDRGANARDIPSTSYVETTDYRAKKENFSCRRCGTRHAMRNCPAYGKKCGNCNALGHFEEFCQSPAMAKNNYYDNRATGMNPAQQKNFYNAPINQNPVKAVNKEVAFRNTNVKKRNKSTKDNSPDCCIA